MNISQKKTEEKILEFINDNNLISKNDKVIVALSGGADSVFALTFFLKFRQLFNISLFAAHINHSLRGKESDADEQFCKDFCDKNGIEFFTERVDVVNYAKQKKLSIEEAARDLRYGKLHQLADRLKANKIVVAHNADDNSETILLNFFKGTGLSGLSGIPIKRDKIIRPILHVTKNEIVEYLQESNIPFRVDSSNKNIDFERNFLRHKIIPLIKEKINPNIDGALLRNSEIIKNFYTSFKEYVKKIADNYCTVENENVKLNLSVVNDYGSEMFGEILKLIFEKYLNINFDFKDFKSISELINNQKGRKIQLSSEIFVIKESSFLLFTAIQNNEDMKDIGVGETVKFENKKISISEVDKNNYILTSDKKNEFISGDNIFGKFLIRRWKNGDKFIPLGRTSFKKLSDFLTDEKISYLEKKNQLVLTNNKNIVWVVGRRIDERYKVLPSTKKVYKLCLN